METIGLNSVYIEPSNTAVAINMPKEKLEPKISESWSMIWNTFMNKTTMHGFQHVVGFRRRKIRG